MCASLVSYLPLANAENYDASCMNSFLLFLMLFMLRVSSDKEPSKTLLIGYIRTCHYSLKTAPVITSIWGIHIMPFFKVKQGYAERR